MAKLFTTDAEFDVAMAMMEEDSTIPANDPKPPVMPSAEIIPFTSEWPALSSRFMGSELPPAPTLPLEEVLPSKLAVALRLGARTKSAPIDYVFAALLSGAASLIGNTRWVSPQDGWSEPTVIWMMLIGAPSASKSPAFDIVMKPLREIEKLKRKNMQSEIEDWNKKAEVAGIAETVWKAQTKKAIAAGETPPDQPEEMSLPAKPYPPRIIINDATIEMLAVILANQPRGSLQHRDEMAGWLEGMERYSGGGDRPFWLESCGGRHYSVDRIGRESLIVEHLLMSVMGGIQPEKLNSLLFETANDGLIPRLIPIYPDPAPIEGPIVGYDASYLQSTLERLSNLQMCKLPDGDVSPLLVHFTNDATNAMLEFRRELKKRGERSEGLMASFLGKCPGLSARLSLVLGFLAWASGDAVNEPTEITLEQFIRARLLIKDYILPMAHRAYGLASVSKDEILARRLVALIREKQWSSFSTRDVLRLGRKDLDSASALNPILTRLEDAGVIKSVAAETVAKGGRPPRIYAVNPAIL